MRIVGAMACLLLVVGCGPDSPSTAAEPGEEATSESSPTQEDSVPPDEGGDGGEGEADEVSVDLPGLPIGGDGAVFSTEDPTQCVDISWTGPTLPDGVALELTDVTVPPEFSSAATPCSEAPCLGGGYRITSATGGCTVWVTWGGRALADPANSVVRADAKAYCTSQAVCDDVAAAADAVNEQTGGASSVMLIVFDDPSEESSPSDDIFDDPSEESSPSDDIFDNPSEESSPSDDISDDPSEESSPSDDGSGG